MRLSIELMRAKTLTNKRISTNLCQFRANFDRRERPARDKQSERTRAAHATARANARGGGGGFAKRRRAFHDMDSYSQKMSQMGL